MQRLVIAALLCAFAADAQAITRHTSTSMTCEQVRQTIRREGAAIMQYGSQRVPGLRRYDRYVSSAAYCETDDTTRTAYIPASDRPNCPVLECYRFDFYNDD